MQAAHTWALTGLELDREFESTPLRHTVWIAENLAFPTMEILGFRRVSSNLPAKLDCRDWTILDAQV